MTLSLYKKNKTALGAAFLVSGCCIGAGMIGLPVMSAMTGFMPATIAMLLCYLFTTATGLLLLEATLWFDDKVNLPSIVGLTLGRFSKVITLILFLSLFYCLFVAYLDGGGSLFADMLTAVLHHPIGHMTGTVSCLLFVGIITYLGTHTVAGFNRILLIGLILSYLILISIGLTQVSFNNLTKVDLKATFGTIPILLICFGYQNLVPSLTYYLEKNINHIRFAIIIGNLLPFFIYLIWNFVIIGMISVNFSNTDNTTMVTELLQHAVPTFSILFFVKAFSLFAMLTSFLPNAISFIDFLKDGLKHSTYRFDQNNWILYGLVFIPPFICTLFYPHLFLQALGFAGGFLDILLFGVLPAMVILIGRRIKKIAGPYQVAGGYCVPILVLLLSLMVLYFKLS